MNTFNTLQSIGDIVSIMPKAGEIFEEYRIDFCCGGSRPLSEAIQQQNLNEPEVLAKLEEAYAETRRFTAQTDFRKMEPGGLADYIVNNHHVFTKKILPEISDLATTILRVHGLRHSDLFKVHKLFHTLKTELEQHLIKEEEILFPLIKEYGSQSSKELFDKIDKVIKETEEEHETAGDVLKELRKVTEEYQVPEDGCSSFSLT